MTTAKQSRSTNAINDFVEFNFDKILKRLPVNLNDISIEKSGQEEILNILLGTKSIIALGALTSGKKLISLLKKRYENISLEDLVNQDNKRHFVIYIGLMFDSCAYDETHAYVKSFGEKIFEELLLSDTFKILWTLLSLEITNPDIKSAEIYFNELLVKKDVPPASIEYLYINYLYLLFDKKIITAEEVLKRCEALQDAKESSTTSYKKSLQARAYLALGKTELAYDYANQFYNETPANLVELSFGARKLLHSIKPNEDDLENLVLLNLYPLLQKRLSTQSLIEDENEDVFVIQDHKITTTKYSLVDHDKKEAVLDLVSGFYNYKNRKTFLSKNRVLAIKAIMSMGDLGIKDFLIGEYVFLGENVGFNSIRKRSQDLVTQLQKIGIPLTRKDNTIFYKFDNPLTIIVGTGEYRSELAYLKTKHNVINKKIVTYELMTKPSTSSLYLKKWREENRISPTNDPYGDYRFN